jgi:uncharacterized membrane-anchored protein YhcB (DUF1043 family)
MAEIKIEKKKPIWPWVLLGLLVLGLIIYFLVFYDSNGEDREQITDTTVTTDQTQDPINNNTVSEYVTFVQADTSSMGLDHEYTNEALLKLTNATEAMADEVGYDVERDIQNVRDYAQKITQDPFETTHANNIRDAANILANVLQNIQQAEFPNLANQASEVKNAAEAITPEELTLDQKQDVKSFFNSAASLLEEMNISTRT